MELDQDTCFRALRTRDARFDGRFFTAVRSTGIYCRPICPARTPKRENCLFLPCAAAAQQLGYRPCRRCRPEVAPGTPAWSGTATTVSRALRLISEGALDSGSVAALAERLGLGERQLRRLFVQHLGTSPLAVAQTRRVLFAKQLIDETSLAMSQVALAAGFASIRRFNAAMRQTYGVAPRELRRRPEPSGSPVDLVDVCLRLSYRPPFDWAAIVEFLAPRAIPGVESVSPGGYRRSIATPNGSGLIEVQPVSDGNHLLARIRLNEPVPLEPVVARIRRIFDLAADPAIIASDLGQSPWLRQAVRTAPGIRVPGAWSGFELAVRAILGQQVTVKGATTLCGRLVERFGTASRLCCDGLDFLFPTPAVLAGADLTAIGLPRTRAATIAAISAAVDSGDLDLETPRDLDRSLVQLTAFPGIGEWTAQYIAMRALREPDAFPASDLGLRRALGRNGAPLREGRLAAIAEGWRPWRAYAAMLLWSGPVRRHRPGDRGSRRHGRRG